MKARAAVGRFLYHPRTDRPIFGVLQCTRPMRAEGASQSLAKIDERLKLIHLAAEMLLFERRKPFRVKQFIRAGEIECEAIVTHSKRHLGREVIYAVISEAEVAREFLNRHQLQR